MMFKKHKKKNVKNQQQIHFSGKLMKVYTFKIVLLVIITKQLIIIDVYLRCLIE